MTEQIKTVSKAPRLAIRFDGPPAHESGRFVEVELNGASVSIGEWEQDGEYWLLVLKPEYAVAPELLKALDDIAKGMVPGAEMPSMDKTPLEFRSEMWSWSQKRAREATAKVEGV